MFSVLIQTRESGCLSNKLDKQPLLSLSAKANNKKNEQKYVRFKGNIFLLTFRLIIDIIKFTTIIKN